MRTTHIILGITLILIGTTLNPTIHAADNPSQNTITVEAGGPYYGMIDQYILFNATTSNTPDPAPALRYDWKFHAADTWHLDLGPTPSHIYHEPGKYTATVRITDTNTNQGTDTATIIISQPNQPPTQPTITILSTPDNETTNYIFSFLSIDLDNDPLTYTVNWGDGTLTTSDPMPNGSEYQSSHAWTTNGVYLLTVSTMDPLNATSTIATLPIPINSPRVTTIGYLTDNDNNGHYEQFFNPTTYTHTQTQPRTDGTYLLDVNNDGTYDYTYNPTTQTLTAYLTDTTPTSSDTTLSIMIGIILILTIIGIVAIAWKNNTQK